MNEWNLGDIKDDWVSGGRKVQGQSPGGGLGNEVPQKLKLFCEATIIFALKYNKQQYIGGHVPPVT